MPGLKKEDLQDIFTYHPPTEGQPEKYEAIRKAALDFATVLMDNTPPSADQTVAIRKLRECVHIANASIALKGKY